MKWKLRSKKAPKDIQELKKIMLKNREISESEELFFNPTSPADLTLEAVAIDKKQMSDVIKRIKQAKKNDEYIVIFGDYDADGICATAILWQTLFDMGCNVKPFIPNRKTHGYGVSTAAIVDIIKDKKPDLLITVDNGIVAFKPVAYLKNLGVDVIITDHHQPEVEAGKLIFPNADNVVHSTKLCGATVAWMITRELDKKNSQDSLDLCGVATIADQVKLYGPNRSFAKFGIEALKKSKRIGLDLLIKETIKDRNLINSDSVGFIIAPRINAMGRMSDGTIALRFLCTKNRKQAKSLLVTLIETNENRKSLTYELLDHANEQIKIQSEENIIIVYSDHYHEGILGLIAGSILERHGKPAIAISMGEKFAKASVRSVPGLNIVDFLREIRDDLLELGGHPMAAGFGFEPKKIDLIKKRLLALAKEKISKDLLTKTIKSECVLPAELIEDKTIDLIDKFRPFGQGNRKPIFEIRDIELEEAVSMGSEGTHLRLKLAGGLKAIGWRMGKRLSELESGSKISIVGSLEFNIWQNYKNIQIILKDFKS